MRKSGLKIFTLLAVFLLMSMTFHSTESRLVLNPYYSVAGAGAQGPTSRIRLLDTDYSHYLALMWNENRAANQTLNFITGAGDRTVTLSGDLTVESASLVNQDLTTDSATAQLATLTISTSAVLGDGDWIGNGSGAANPRIAFDDTNDYLEVLGGDFFTDRWLSHATNTAFGVGVFGADNLTHGSGNEGRYNSAFGYNSLNAITTGYFNSAFGYASLVANTTGYFNSAFGHNSLVANTTGYHNSAFGPYALSLVNPTGAGEGIGNIGFGYSAGDNITTGSYNLIIGYNLDAASATGNYQINIGGVYKGTTSGGTAAAVLDAITFINDTANAKMTTGLTINQGDTDDEILALKASDVAHGMTNTAETDTYGHFMKQYANNGGLRIGGFSESGYADAIVLYGAGGSTDTAKTTAALAPVMTRAYVKSGTSVGPVGADGNIFVICTENNARFIFDEDGDMFYDGAAPANYDAFDDAAACFDVQRVLYNMDKPKERQLMDFKKYTASELIDMGVISDGGFVSTKRMNALILGAVGQLDDEGKAQAQRIDELEAQVTQLQAIVEAQAQQLQEALALVASRQERVQ